MDGVSGESGVGTEFRSLEDAHPEAAERIRAKVAERIERAGS